MSQSIIQNFAPVDLHNLTKEQQTFLDEVKSLKPQLNKPMVADNTQHLELNFTAGVTSVSYVSSRAYLTTGEQVYYWVTADHAKALAHILKGKQLFFFELMLTTFAPGAMRLFVDGLRGSETRIENLFINHVSGDELTEEAAELWPELITILDVQSFSIKNNEYPPKAIDLLCEKIAELPSDQLQHANVFPFSDDPRGPGRLIHSSLENFAKNRKHEKLNASSEHFNEIMNLLVSLFDEEQFDVCLAYCQHFLETKNFDPVQFGWIAYYRHKSQYGSKNIQHFTDAVDFLQKPGILFSVGQRNMLWMLSTAGEMSFTLKDKIRLQHFIDSYVKVNGENPSEPESIRNLVRHYSNAYHYWNGLNDEDIRNRYENLLLERLRKDTELTKEIKGLPKEVLDKLHSH